MRKDPKLISRIARSTLLVVLGILALVVLSPFMKSADKDTISVNQNPESPVALVGGGGERIYLRYGTIYALRDDPDKEYNIANYTIHVTSERYKKLIFFNTPEEAEAAGFKPSEHFAEDYACYKAGKDSFECSGATWISSSTNQ